MTPSADAGEIRFEVDRLVAQRLRRLRAPWESRRSRTLAWREAVLLDRRAPVDL